MNQTADNFQDDIPFPMTFEELQRIRAQKTEPPVAPPENPILTIALELISEGVSVIPLQARSKVPALDSWKVYQERLATEEEVRTWFADPTLNYAIICGPVSGNLLGYDFDTKEAEKTFGDTYASLVSGCPVVKPSRGHHLYVRTDLDVASCRKDGYEVHGNGTYLVGPGSTHPSGKKYKIVRGDMSKIPVIEAELLGLSDNGEGVQHPKGWQDELFRGLPDGERTDALESLCGRYLAVKPKLDRNEILAILLYWNSTCNPPLPLEKVESTLDSMKKTDERNHPQEKKRGYKLVQIADLPLQQPRWLIKWFLELDEFSELFGDPGAGKTIMAVDWACRIATGTPWCGIQIRQGSVIYVCGEGQRSIRRRIRAWEIRNEIDLAATPLYILPHAVQIITPESMNSLNKAIINIIEKSGDPALVVFDTLSRNFGPGNEGLPADMGLAISAADALRQKWKCCVLFIHHPGHGDKQRGRGGSNLQGALDTDYLIEKDSDDVVRLEAKKTKDGNPPAPKAFRLREVALGLQDEDGCEITSVVLDEIDYEAREEKGKAVSGSQQLLMMEILHGLVKQYQQNLEKTGHDPEEARVAVEDWRVACKDKRIAKSTFYRNQKVLAELGNMRIEHGYVYPLL